MKYLAIITLAIACLSCDNLNDTESALKNYIEASIDKPGSYKSVEIKTATETEIINILNLQAHFANVESVIFRIHRIAKSVRFEFEGILPENALSKIDTIISMYIEDEELTFKKIDLFSSETLKLPLQTIVRDLEFPDSGNKHKLLAQSVMFESAADRLKVETGYFFGQIGSRLRLVRNLSAPDLFASIESGNFIIHEYQVNLTGSRVLKSGLFVFDEGIIIGSAPAEVTEQ